MTSKSLQDPVERLSRLAERLRSRDGIEWSTAKFVLPRESARVEFFRGRDFERYFEAHTDLVDEYGTGKTAKEKLMDLGNRFLKSGLIVKAQRKFKKPKPGKKRLVKWPRTLLPLPSKEGWERDAFYVWKMERPTSAWTYILSGLLVLAIFAGCLLPIAPFVVRRIVFYVSLTFLIFIAGFFSIRTGIWLVVWMVSGRDFWILPNILSDEMAMKDVIKPLMSFEKVEGPRSHVAFRLLSGAAMAGLCVFLLNRNPGGKVVMEQARKAHDDLLDFLSIRPQITEVQEDSKEEL